MSDGTDKLCKVLYGDGYTSKHYVGGSQARMLHDGAERINAQAKEIELLKGLINEVLHAKEDGAFDWAVWDKQAIKALEGE